MDGVNTAFDNAWNVEARGFPVCKDEFPGLESCQSAGLSVVLSVLPNFRERLFAGRQPELGILFF